MRRFIYILGVSSGIVLTLIGGIMCAEVFCRYVLHKPILGTVEISSYLLVLFVYTGMAYTQSIDGHITVDVLMQRLSSKAQHVLRLGGLVLTLAIFTVITWRTTSAFWASWQIKEVRMGALPLPVYPVKFAVAAGSFCLCLQFLISIWDELRYRAVLPAKE